MSNIFVNFYTRLFSSTGPLEQSAGGSKPDCE